MARSRVEMIVPAYGNSVSSNGRGLSRTMRNDGIFPELCIVGRASCLLGHGRKEDWFEVARVKHFSTVRHRKEQKQAIWAVAEAEGFQMKSASHQHTTYSDRNGELLNTSVAENITSHQQQQGLHHDEILPVLSMVGGGVGVGCN